MAICGKIVDYISGHKQFDGESAISNFKKILSKNISPFGTVKKTTRMLLVALSLTCLEITFVVKGAGTVILLFHLEYKMSVVSRVQRKSFLQLAIRAS